MAAPETLYLTETPTTLTQQDVTALMETANISPTQFEFRIPNKHDRANQPPKGYISVYKKQIEMGLRFPLHDLLLDILNRLKVSPSQLRPLSHAMVAGFILCAKLYDIPATSDCFFTVNNVDRIQADDMFRFVVEPWRSLKFLLADNESFWDDDEWMKEFFFLRPVGNSWNCVTKWRKTECSAPKVNAAYFQELVKKSGLLQSGGFEITELMRKDVLIHGGIEPPGDVSPRFTFRYLMHRAAMNKFELLPEDMPPANAIEKVASKRPLSQDQPFNSTLINGEMARCYELLCDKSSVIDTRSKINEYYPEVRCLMQFANISPTDYKFLIPKRNDRANKPPEGYISVYKEQIERGLRFPLHPLVVEICNRLEVSPSQLRPTAHAMIAGFILCAKLYDLPTTADCFFTLFKVYKPDAVDMLFSFREKIQMFKFLKRGFPFTYRWTKEFFFLKPVGKSWNCITKWSENHCHIPVIDAALQGSLLPLLSKSGMLGYTFELSELLRTDVLVHGGIEPGIPSPEFTFRYLMHKAAVNKFELLPEDIPPTNVTTTAANKRPHVSRWVCDSAYASILSNSADSSAASSDSEESIHEVSSSSTGDKVSSKKLCREGEEVSDGAQTNSAVLVSDETQPQPTLALPQPPSSPLLAISKTLESMFVPKESYEKLEKGKEEVTSELALTKSRVQELEQEIELYKAKRVESDYRTSQAMVKVKILEKRLENVKSELDCLRDKIKKEVMDEFKSSDDFANAVHEEAVKYYVNGFETCKLRVLNSGELPSGFNFDFLDVADSEWGSSDSSPMPVDKAMDDLGKKSLKRKKT